MPDVSTVFHKSQVLGRFNKAARSQLSLFVDTFKVVAEELDDSDFEDRTQASDPADAALPWFISL